ncbi:MAG: hypothetical protein R6W68_12035 [Ignavibacteriaceae bacterium]
MKNKQSEYTFVHGFPVMPEAESYIILSISFSYLTAIKTLYVT